TSYEAQLQGISPTRFLRSHIIGIILGLVAMFSLSLIDYHFWKRFTVLAYLVACGLILLVLTPLGKSANGATRWIYIGSLSFQPAEFAKIAIIIFMARLVERNYKPLKTRSIKVMISMIVWVIPLAVLIWQITNNLSSAIIVFGIAAVMIFVATPRYDIFIVFGTIAVVGITVFVMNIENLAAMGDNFRLNRVLAWKDPEAYPLDTGFQTLQGLYAIGSGGLFGKGLGNSIQKLSFLPEPQNDMIFAIICEELGLFGACCVILMFMFMLWRFMVIANNAPDLYGSMIVVGVMAHIAIQVILNIAVVTNTIPNTGITLPFISYGGTSALFLTAEMGLVLSVSRSIKVEY
ncbi:MAG: FtsW/RodA/SpoVE family cell cycle protein, partial [Lachnospiraceae bacterium]|nr:FtsW/RodA/SpoVE family cell cycle protein [Lachnospiraceae bacterium]